MALGVCCHWIRHEVAPRSGKSQVINELDERTLQLGRYERGSYAEDSIRSLYLHNVRMLRDVLRKVAASGVRLFRVSSAMFPLSDRVPRGLWDKSSRRPLMRRGSAHPHWRCAPASLSAFDCLGWPLMRLGSAGGVHVPEIPGDRCRSL